jgi:hypothetical protein
MTETIAEMCLVSQTCPSILRVRRSAVARVLRALQLAALLTFAIAQPPSEETGERLLEAIELSESYQAVRERTAARWASLDTSALPCEQVGSRSVTGGS